MSNKELIERLLDVRHRPYQGVSETDPEFMLRVSTLARDAAKSLEALEWQPIETAPTDRPIQIKTAKGLIFGVEMLDRFTGHNCEEVSCWAAMEEEFYPDCWTDGVCWAMNENEEESDQPTYWKPLTPPESEEQ